MKIKTKMYLNFIGLVGIMTPIAGTLSCSSTEKKDAGMTVYTATDSFTGTITNGFKEEASKLGFSVNLQDSANDQTKQMTQIKSMIDKGVKVLVVNLADLKAGKRVIDKAKEAGVPLILYNREASQKEMSKYDKVWYLGPIGADSGRAQARTIHNDLILGNIKDRNKDGKLKYIIIGGEEGHSDAMARTIFSQSELRKIVKEKGVNHDQFNAKLSEAGVTKIPNPNPYILIDSKNRVYIKRGINDGQIASIFGTTFSPSGLSYTKWGSDPGTQSIISSLITQANGENNNLDFMMTNADPSAIIAGKWATSNAGGFKRWTSNYASSSRIDYLPIYGVNGGNDVIDEIIKGIVAGTVFQDGYKQGQALAKMVYNIINKKSIEDGLNTKDFDLTELKTNTKAVRSKYYAVNRENIKNGALDTDSLGRL